MGSITYQYIFPSGQEIPKCERCSDCRLFQAGEVGRDTEGIPPFEAMLSTCLEWKKDDAFLMCRLHTSEYISQKWQNGI